MVQQQKVYNRNIQECQTLASSWFFKLRDIICSQFEAIEAKFASGKKFTIKKWDRDGLGGGEMGIMYGDIFEKVGVNISVVHGEFSDHFAREIPSTEHDKRFWASGVSVVAHMKSPLVPAIHMNTRMMTTQSIWFGGGIDLTPTLHDEEEEMFFHEELRKVCDRTDPSYYEKFKAECDNYFFIPHRGEARGIGGIFYDYMNTGDWDKDFTFCQNVGLAFPDVFTRIIEKKVAQSWTAEEKEQQLVKRGRYAEFNLMYDRGTRFGLMTGGNTEAILMSMPPYCKW